MVELTFFGGVNEIGGNKILLEDNETKIFLDFGMSFNESKKYYSEFLQPRTCNGLGDLIELGITPDFKGIYRDDLLTNEGRPLTEKPVIDAVFISHAHADHCWHVSLLHPDIPIHCGFTCKLMLQAAQETSQGTYYTDFYKYRECFVDRRKKPERLRNFKTFRTGDKIKVNEVEVEPIHVDHSIPGAYGFLIYTSEGCIVYSGDIRLHGPKKDMTEDFIEAAKVARPIALIIEGTNIDERLSLTEAEVFDKVTTVMKNTEKLVLFDFPIRDVDRLNTFFKAAEDNDRNFVTSMKQAYLIELLNKEDKKLTLPPIDAFNIFLDRIRWGRYEKRDYKGWQTPYLDYDNAVKADDISGQQNKYMLFMDFFGLTELLDIKPSLGSVFIHSLTEPFNEEMEFDFNRIANWLGKFKITLEHAHASGHANGKQLKDIAETIAPKQLFPIHTEKVGMFKQLIKRSIVIPELGRSYRL